MELSEDMLRGVFDSVDVHGHGYLNVDEIKAVMSQVGANVTAEDIEGIDPEGSGKVSFEGFVAAVGMILAKQEDPMKRATSAENLSSLGSSEALNRIGLGNGNDSDPGSEHDDDDGNCSQSTMDHSFGDYERNPDEEMDSFSPETRQTPATLPRTGRTLPRIGSAGTVKSRRTPPPRMLKRSSSLATFSSHGSDFRVTELELQVASLQKAQEAGETKRLELEEELGILTQKHTLLQKTCAEYQTQLADAEDFRESRASVEFEQSMVKLRREQDDLEDARKQLQAAEIALSTSTSQKDLLNKSLASEKELADEAAQRATDLERRLQDAENEFRDMEAELSQRVQAAEAEHEEVMQSTIGRLEAEAEARLQEAVEEREVLVRKLEQVERQADETRQALEEDLAKLHTQNASMEAALSDPTEYQRQFINKGLQLTSFQVESLEAELNQASREDLLEELKRCTESNNSLKVYVDQLLAIVIDRIPDILEIKA